MTAGSGFGAGADLPGAAAGQLADARRVRDRRGRHDGWGSVHTLGFGGGAVALMVGFMARQATAAKPLMALRVFRSRDVAGANLIQMLMVAGIFGLFFLGALYLETCSAMTRSRSASRSCRWRSESP